MNQNNIQNYTQDSILVTLDDGSEHRIRVAGSVYDPHFFGKDVCQIMEIKDFKQAIQDLVLEHQKQHSKI